MKHLTGLAPALVLGIAALGVVPSLVSAQTPTEYEVKAAFLFNFIKFVEWPVEAFADVANDAVPVTIGVSGENPFGNALDEAVRGKMVAGHRILVKRVRSTDDLARLHVLFLSDSDRERVGQFLQRIGDKSVLTISDIEQFCQSGGVIAFLTEHGKVRFEINLTAAERHRLKISSRLLTLATKVHRSGE